MFLLVNGQTMTSLTIKIDNKVIGLRYIVFHGKELGDNCDMSFSKKADNHFKARFSVE